jgi:hypothetical protein
MPYQMNPSRYYLYPYRIASTGSSVALSGSVISIPFPFAVRDIILKPQKSKSKKILISKKKDQ